MKTMLNTLVSFCLILCLSVSTLSAQDQPVVITFTVGHWNFDKTDGSPDKWLAIEKEYHEKVTMQNEHILATEFLLHYFTTDNSEYALVNVYTSFEGMEKANKRTGELVEAGWPDTIARAAFFKEQGSYYANQHSDEIYAGLPNSKPVVDSLMTKPHIYYMQVHELAFSDDLPDNIGELRKEFVETVHHGNKYVKGFYNMRHLWGSNNRDQVDVTVFESLADLEKGLQNNGKLIEAHWPDEAKRDAFFEEYDKIHTGIHGDYLWRNVPELRK